MTPDLTLLMWAIALKLVFNKLRAPNYTYKYTCFPSLAVTGLTGVEISTFFKFYLNISEEAALTATIHTFEQIFIPIYNSKGPGKVVEKKKTKKQGVVLRFDYFLKVSQISCFHYTSCVFITL